MKTRKSLLFGKPSRSSRKAATSRTLATDARAFNRVSCIQSLLSFDLPRNGFRDQQLGEDILVIDLARSKYPPVLIIHDGNRINLWRRFFARINDLAGGLAVGKQ